MMETDLAMYRAGYRGEQILDYHLSGITSPHFAIFHNLRLFDHKNPFQLDTLLLTPSFALIIEAKHLSGKLIFENDFDQCIRIKNDQTKERIENPIAQSARQQSHLQSLFRWMEVDNLPVHSIVAFTHPSIILETSSPPPKYISQLILVENVVNRIRKHHHFHSKNLLTTSQFERLQTRLLHKHAPLIHALLKKYDIPPGTLRKGVQCEKCNNLSMTWKRRSWECSVCKFRSRTAHIAALLDYFLLVQRSISIRECCDFLGLDKRHVAYYLLNSMGLSTVGKSKATRYVFNFESFGDEVLNGKVLEKSN